MKMADELATAVLTIQQNSQTAYEQRKLELVARREKARLALADSAPTDELKQRRIELEKSVWQAESDVAAMQQESATVTEKNLKYRETVFDLLLETGESYLSQTNTRRTSFDFRAVLEGFSEQLATAGFNLLNASEEEQVRMLPWLQSLASTIRAMAKRQAIETSNKLGTLAIAQRRWDEHEEQRKQVEQDFDATVKRLSSHGLDPGAGLVAEICQADKRVAQRLLREIIETQLADAKIERQRQLIGTDPLQHLERAMA